MSQNPKKIGKYEIGRVLGKGNFSKVRLAIDSTNGEKYANKIIDKALLARDHLEDQIRREISILKVLRHKYVVQMREAFQTAKHMYVVMELVEGGELFDMVADKGRLTEDEARKYFQQLVVAIKYCHANKIAHRDLKLENLLLDRHGNLKISDFGLANMQATPDSSVMRTVCGTPNYVAPEVIRMNGQPRSAQNVERQTGYNGFTADVWSCGIILFIMLSGRQAFEDEDLRALFNKIERGQYQMSRYIPDGPRSLIEKMLHTDPAQRIDLAGIIKNPWFQVKFDPAELSVGIERPALAVEEDADALKNAVTNVDAGPLSPMMSPLRANAALPARLPARDESRSPRDAAGLGAEQGVVPPVGLRAVDGSSPGVASKAAAATSPQQAHAQSTASLHGGGLDGLQLANMLIANALTASPYVDLQPASASSPSKAGGAPPASAASRAAGNAPLSPAGAGSPLTPATSNAPVYGAVRHFVVRASAAQSQQLASDWLKTVLPSALRSGSSQSSAQPFQELRGFLTTPRGIMTFVMEVQPTVVANVCVVVARKGMGDSADFAEGLKGFGKKLAEAKLLLSEELPPAPLLDSAAAAAAVKK